MRSRIFRIVGLLGVGPLSLFVFIGLAVAPFAAMGTDASYINYGAVTNPPPQIDATNFVNYGTFNISTIDPFETSNTRYFTNVGTLTGAAGWRFDTAPSVNGVHRLAASFFNDNTGVVQALDSLGTIIIGQPNVSFVFPSYLFVSATNIVSKGFLGVGADGWLQLAGTNVNLARSGLEVASISPLGSFNNTPAPTNFLPDVAITDLWWGQTNLTFNTANIWNGGIATTPVHGVQARGGVNLTVQFSVANPFADSYTNIVGGLFLTITNIDGSTTDVFAPTNITRQAVFVGNSDPANMSVAVRYFDSTSPTNFFKTVAVEIAVQSTNVVTTSPETTALYFYDTLASETNRGLYLNVFANFTSRPANYLLSRIDDGRFFFGLDGNNGVPDAGFLWNNTFSNSVVPGAYAGYAAFVDNLVTRPPPVLGGTVTNLPGRIRIFADSLDLSRTRMRGEGEIIVQARHLVGSSNAVVDCENLSFTLGSTNGLLNILNLTKESVARFKGEVFAWSGLWSNQFSMIFTNYDFNTNNMPPATLSPLTNTVQVDLHTLILDGSALLTQLPVKVYDMVTHSTNVVISDNMIVVQSLLFDGESFTLKGTITLSSVIFTNTAGQGIIISLSDWISTNAPNLLYFTNYGTLNIPSEAHFGDDRPIPYSSFVNTGTISAASISLDSEYFENSGTLRAQGGPLIMLGGAGKLENGRSISTGDTQLLCDSLKFNKYQLTANGGVYLGVASALFDAGGSSSNIVQMQDGFFLFTKPPSGDLLGTTFQTGAPNFREVDHYWAGEDRGLSPSGYFNNVALGKLEIGPVGFDPLFFFAGADAQNGLYVDLLDLTALGSGFQDLMEIDPSLVIYFAAAQLGFTPPTTNGVPQLPEEYLDGLFGGHLRWVRDFPGPNSSVDVVINGVTVKVNRAVRNSKIIDSDGDGIPNFYDPTPFGGVVLTGALAQTNQPASKAFSVSWQAAPNKVYHVQFTTNPMLGNWQPLLNYTNTAPTNKPVTIWDTNVAAGVQRFYRVGYSP